MPRSTPSSGQRAARHHPAPLSFLGGVYHSLHEDPEPSSSDDDNQLRRGSPPRALNSASSPSHPSRKNKRRVSFAPDAGPKAARDEGCFTRRAILFMLAISGTLVFALCQAVSSCHIDIPYVPPDIADPFTLMNEFIAPQMGFARAMADVCLSRSAQTDDQLGQRMWQHAQQSLRDAEDTVWATADKVMESKAWMQAGFDLQSDIYQSLQSMVNNTVSISGMPWLIKLSEKQSENFLCEIRPHVRRLIFEAHRRQQASLELHEAATTMLRAKLSDLCTRVEEARDAASEYRTEKDLDVWGSMFQGRYPAVISTLWSTSKTSDEPVVDQRNAFDCVPDCTAKDVAALEQISKWTRLAVQQLDDALAAYRAPLDSAGLQMWLDSTATIRILESKHRSEKPLNSSSAGSWLFYGTAVSGLGLPACPGYSTAGSTFRRQNSEHRQACYASSRFWTTLLPSKGDNGFDRVLRKARLLWDTQVLPVLADRLPYFAPTPPPSPQNPSCSILLRLSSCQSLRSLRALDVARSPSPTSPPPPETSERVGMFINLCLAFDELGHWVASDDQRVPRSADAEGRAGRSSANFWHF